MSQPLESKSRLAELLSAACNETLADDERTEFKSLLVDNPEAQRAYLRYCQLHSALLLDGRAHQSAQAAFDKVREAEGKLSAVSSQPLATEDRRQRTEDREQPDTELPRPASLLASSAAVPCSSQKSWLNRASRHPLVPSIGIAAMVFVALFVGMALTPMGQWIAGGDGDNKNGLKPAPETEHVAILNNWHSAVWLDGTRPPLGDPRLKVGQRLVLSSGLAEVTYDTGATVVLEGPAEFVVLSKKRCALDFGKLVGHCDDEKAKGFVVETPGANVKDLGTEFAVDVDRRGRAYVEVFDGKVSVGDRATPARYSLVELGAELAAVVNVAEGGSLATIRRITPDGRRFARALPREKPVAELLAHYTFDDKSTANVAGKANQLTAHGDPQFIATEIEGLGDAIDLDGVDDYAICAGAVHPLGNDSYTWAVWVRFDELPQLRTSNRNLIQWGAAQPDGGTFVGLNCTQESPRIRVNHISSDTDRTSSYTPTSGQYLHLVGTRKGLRERIYVNGQLQDVIRYNSGIRTARGPMVIGCMYAGAITEHSKAQIADVQIYKGFVDDQQIEFLYKHPGDVLSSAEKQEDQ